MRIARWALLGMITAVAAASATAAPVALTGEVIDPGLYVREGRHGAETEEQIYDAVDGGQSLGVLEDKTQSVYLSLAAQPGDDPNEWLYEYIGRRVSVTGEVYVRGGVKGIVISGVQPLDQPPADAPEGNSAADSAP